MAVATEGAIGAFGRVAQLITELGMDDLRALRALIDVRLDTLIQRTRRPTATRLKQPRLPPHITTKGVKRPKSEPRTRPKGPCALVSRFANVPEYKAYSETKNLVVRKARDLKVDGLKGLRALSDPEVITLIKDYDDRLAAWFAWKNQYYTDHPEERPATVIQEQETHGPTADAMDQELSAQDPTHTPQPAGRRSRAPTTRGGGTSGNPRQRRRRRV